LHYRHHYHAGNFADVFKHVLVTGLLTALSRKDKPWAFVDTHAGAGDYDLGDPVADRTGEWRDGIGRLADVSVDAAATPPAVAAYLRLVRAGNADGGCRFYPGSPRLAQQMLRPVLGDRLILCEKIEEVADELRRTMRGSGATIHVRDGYEAHSLLPPPEKRALVLIDPPFERTDEYEAVSELIRKSVARFANGIYAAWYPIKNTHVASSFVRRVARETGKPTLQLSIEVDIPAREPSPVTGVVKHPMSTCGLVVVNPPFGFDAEMRAVLAYLTPILAQGSRAEWTVSFVD